MYKQKPIVWLIADSLTWRFMGLSKYDDKYAYWGYNQLVISIVTIFITLVTKSCDPLKYATC